MLRKAGAWQMIIDTHLHTFPPLTTTCGRPTIRDHLNRMQRTNYGAVNRPRRARDNSVVVENTLWNGKGFGPDGLADVNFRVGKYGRMEWTVGNDDIYLQWFAPSLREIESPPEFMVVEMDYAGVDVGILQNTYSYGLLNDFFAECVQRFPHRYVSTIQVLEPWAHTDEQMEALVHGARTQGHKGIFYQAGGFFFNDYRDNPDDRKYDIFWNTVEQLGLVVYWDPAGTAQANPESYLDQIGRMLRVVERNPKLRVIIPMAWPIGYFGRDGQYDLPDIAVKAGTHPRVYSELCYPIIWGGTWEYPYVELQPYIGRLCELFGPEKLVWGSDMPNIERFCTYKQSYQYLNHCTFLGERELASILGGNAARLFGIAQRVEP
jgi:predicted TIM-barrel fold metal-dependent hydrolase